MNSTNAIISISTQTGFSYLILFKNDLSEANWKLLKILSGDGTTRLVNDPTGGTQRFYKILVQ
jgi:hypothetical protein